MTRSSISTFALCLLLFQAPAWGFGNSNSNSGNSASGGSGGSGGSGNSGNSNSGGSGSGNSGGSNSGGSNSASSDSSSHNEPPPETAEEKKAREKRLAELAEKLKKQQESEKLQRELQAEKDKAKKPKSKPNNDEDFKIIVPQRVRNEAVHWLAVGGAAQPSMLLRSTLQALRRRLQARGEPDVDLSDAAVISRLVQTM